MAKGIPPTRYFIAPRRLFKCGLSAQEIAIVSYLCSLAGPDEVAWPSVRAITESTKVSRAQVFRVLKALCNAGILASESGGEKHRSNRYTVNWEAIGGPNGLTERLGVSPGDGEGLVERRGGSPGETPIDPLLTDPSSTTTPLPPKGARFDFESVRQEWNARAKKWGLKTLEKARVPKSRAQKKRETAWLALCRDWESPAKVWVVMDRELPLRKPWAVEQRFPSFDQMCQASTFQKLSEGFYQGEGARKRDEERREADSGWQQ